MRICARDRPNGAVRITRTGGKGVKKPSQPIREKAREDRLVGSRTEYRINSLARRVRIPRDDKRTLRRVETTFACDSRGSGDRARSSGRSAEIWVDSNGSDRSKAFRQICDPSTKIRYLSFFFFFDLLSCRREDSSLVEISLSTSSKCKTSIQEATI